MGRAARAKREKLGQWNPTCIIQARMGSTRLPGKTLMYLSGKTVLERVVERVREADEIKQIIVATSELEQDDPIVDLCDAIGVDWFRGSEPDVLSRYMEAAEHFDADPIVRVTADCPLIDAGVLNQLVRLYRQNVGVFVANNLEPSFPHGLDAEVFSLAMLKQATQQTGEDYDAEHVTQWMRRQPGAVNLRLGANLHHYRITLDTKEDLTLLRAIYRAYGSLPYVSVKDALELIDRRPELAKLAGVVA